MYDIFFNDALYSYLDKPVSEQFILNINLLEILSQMSPNLVEAFRRLFRGYFALLWRYHGNLKK